MTPGLHETVVHEMAVPVVTPEPVVQTVVDTHRFEAPLVHHASHDVVYETTGYPQHYSTGYGRTFYESTSYPDHTHEYSTVAHVPVAHVPAHEQILGDTYLHDTYVQQQHYPDHYYQ